jgi:Fe-S oxidoreductase
LPRWRRDAFRDVGPVGDGRAGDVALFVDTFNTWFEPGIAHAALRVLQRAGYRVHLPRAAAGARPPCCGRSFLAVGDVDAARAEARRTLAVLRPLLDQGMSVVGLEPSCLLTFRDEYRVMGLGDEAERLAGRAMLFQEFVAAEREAGRFDLSLGPVPWSKALVHGHCHEKAFAATDDIAAALGLVPDLEVEIANTGCCGMAGGFGYEAEHYDMSIRMAELDVLPAVRAVGEDTAIVAGGTSCRQQIRDGADRAPMHVAELLDRAITE